MLTQFIGQAISVRPWMAHTRRRHHWGSSEPES